MTKPRYPQGCAARSKERGQALPPAAWSPASNAWNVNLNNGNANNNHQNNEGLVLAVRGPVASAGEYQGVAFRQLHEAWRQARRQKSSNNQLHFESRLIDNLLTLERQINAGTWHPSPSVCFIATRPKAREIHAPDFSDRVVHHWLVPYLERIWEPVFIHDSFANRTGKGTHAAVRRLKDFVRQISSGQGGGWFLQLDVHNFFNSIHRPTLWAMMKRRLERSGASRAVMQTTHALLRNSPTSAGVRYRATTAELALVPQHKRLENAGPGRGLPIGNLSSQFFANVYLDALDQFVKHELKAKRYLRYVDDFVLVHHDREQLRDWQQQIEVFLSQSLRLKLKSDVRLRPLASGIDFLGYVVYPTHIRVRRRVIAHARESLSQWAARHVHGQHIRATPVDLRHLRDVTASYQGHLRHADCAGLQRDLVRRYSWLRTALVRRRFDYRMDRRQITLECAYAE